jgi:multiple antibiotic resistance protein
MLEVFIPAFVALFVTIDPIGQVPIFVSLTSDLTRAEKFRTSLMAVLIAAVILLGFGFFGKALLGQLGITMPAFQIAGGILLFIIALEMLFSKRTQRKEDSAEEAHKNREGEDLAVFPLAIPLIAGPGAITSIMIWVGTADGLDDQLIALLALGSVLLLVLLFFTMAILSERFLSRTVTNVVTRLLGMLLAALATQSIIDGIQKALLT